MDLRTDDERAYQGFRAEKRERCVALIENVLPEGEGRDLMTTRIRRLFEVEDCERLVAAVANFKRVRTLKMVGQRTGEDLKNAEQEVAYAALGLAVALAV